MKGQRLLFLVSWVTLLLVSIITAAGAIGSLSTAYFAPDDNLVPGFTLQHLREAGDRIVLDEKPAGEAVVDAFRGRRATAATWAFAYAVLSIAVIIWPYRRGERWAWWALIFSVVLAQILSLARAVTLGTALGLTTPGLLLAFSLLGLLLGAPRMFARKSIEDQ
jgi:hypothetical protein